MASFESDSVERASTTDGMESSHQWTTDYEDDDSETEDERNDHNTPNSNDDSDCENSYSGSVIRQSSLQNERKRIIKGSSKRTNLNGDDKPQVQSDTETRNLLDDIGDFDEDYLDLQEAEASFIGEHFVFDPTCFELSEEQFNYYARCFLYLLEKTQGHSQITGALNGSDFRVIQFFRKSFLSNAVLSKIWALSDVNEDGFLNLTEFIVCMHLIVLHLRGNLPIPPRLPSPIRPPLTPTRHLVQLSNGSYSTSFTLNHEDVCCTTTTSATSSASNSSSNQVNTSVMNGTMACSDNMSRSSSHSQQLPNYQSLSYHSQNSQAPLNLLPRPLKMQDFSVSNNTNGILYLQNVDFANSTERNNGENATNGVKQHSLSDDHLYLHAQRELVMAKFSDVPPVLVDSHPTALNATTSSTGLAALESMTSSRGPPPEPPIRDYTTNNTKGHGRSASLDLKTFSALSPYPPKSPHLNYCPPVQEHNQIPLLNQSQLETLNEDLSQINLSQLNDNSKIKYQTNDQAAQTEFDMGKLLFDCEEVFLINDICPDMSGEERCKLLQKINSELENERIKLAQVRLQLQLRIEETEEKLQQHKISSENNTTAPRPTVL